MQRRSGDIEKALQSKGFVREEAKHHTYYTFHTSSGEKTAVYTYMSRGAASESIGNPLLGKMARQCKVPKNDFLRLVDCPLDQAGYEAKLVAAGELGEDAQACDQQQ